MSCCAGRFEIRNPPCRGAVLHWRSTGFHLLKSFTIAPCYRQDGSKTKPNGTARSGNGRSAAGVGVWAECREMDTLLAGAPISPLRNGAFRLMRQSDPCVLAINGLELCVLQPSCRPVADRGERANCFIFLRLGPHDWGGRMGSREFSNPVGTALKDHHSLNRRRYASLSVSSEL